MRWRDALTGAVVGVAALAASIGLQAAVHIGKLDNWADLALGTALTLVPGLLLGNSVFAALIAAGHWPITTWTMWIVWAGCNAAIYSATWAALGSRGTRAWMLKGAVIALWTLYIGGVLLLTSWWPGGGFD